MPRLAMMLFLIVLACPAQSWAAPRWTVLFNGKNLDNFRIAYSSLPVDGRPASALFEVRDGTVHTYPGQAAGSPEPALGLMDATTLRIFAARPETRLDQ